MSSCIEFTRRAHSFIVRESLSDISNKDSRWYKTRWLKEYGEVYKDTFFNFYSVDTLWKALEQFSDVTIIAPKNEQSAKSHSISLHKPLRIKYIYGKGFCILIILKFIKQFFIISILQFIS